MLALLKKVYIQLVFQSMAWGQTIQCINKANFAWTKLDLKVCKRAKIFNLKIYQTNPYGGLSQILKHVLALKCYGQQPVLFENWMLLLSTERFTDLNKLNLPMVVRIRLEPIFPTSPAASKNDACFKSGQNRLENNHLQ